MPDVSLKLKDAQIDFAYSSDLDRAVQTAEEILRFYLQVCLVRVKELREQAKGVYEGKPKEEISNAVERLGLEWYEFRPEGGETLRDTWERVVGVFQIDCVLDPFTSDEVLKPCDLNAHSFRTMIRAIWRIGTVLIYGSQLPMQKVPPRP